MIINPFRFFNIAKWIVKNALQYVLNTATPSQGNDLTVNNNDVEFLKSNAINLNGFDNKFSIESAGFTTGLGEWYFEFYTKVDNGGNIVTSLIDGIASANLGFYIGQATNDNNLYFKIGDNTIVRNTSFTITPNVWTKIKIGRFGNYIDIYVNDIQEIHRVLDGMQVIDFPIFAIGYIKINNNYYYDGEVSGLKFVKAGVVQFDFPFTETRGTGGIQTKVFERVGQTFYTLGGTVNASNDATIDGENINKDFGFTLDANGQLVPASLLNPTLACDESVLTNPTTVGHNGSENTMKLVAFNQDIEDAEDAQGIRLQTDGAGASREYTFTELQIIDLSGPYVFIEKPTATSSTKLIVFKVGEEPTGLKQRLLLEYLGYTLLTNTFGILQKDTNGNYIVKSS